MNHCETCGRKVNRGRTGPNGTNNKRAYHCLVCIQARVLRSLRYESPAMRRWRKGIKK